MTDEELVGILLRVLGALPNSDDMKIARAIAAAEREAILGICVAFNNGNLGIGDVIDAIRARGKAGT